MNLINEKKYVNKNATQSRKKKEKLEKHDFIKNQNIEEQIVLFADIIIDELLKDLYDKAKE